MKLIVLGFDHRSAPTSVRESLAFTGECLGRGLCALKESFPGTEFVLLSTCNRVEVYAAAGRTRRKPASCHRSWLGSTGCRPGVMPSSWPFAVTRRQSAISSASRQAWRAWCPARTKSSARSAKHTKPPRAGGPSGRSFIPSSRGPCAAKRARDETELGRGKLSIASIAVDLARGVFDHFNDKTILIIGAGKMGELALRHLLALRPGAILIANRNIARVRAVADGGDGRASPSTR